MSNSHILKYLFELFYKRYMYQYIGIMFILLIIILIGLIEPTLNIQFLDYALPNKNMGLALRIVCLYGLVCVINLVLGYISRKWSLVLENKIVINAKTVLFHSIQEETLEDSNDERSKKVILLTQDVSVVSSFFFDRVIGGILSLGTIVVIMFFLLQYSAILTLITFLNCIIQIIITKKFIKPFRRLAIRSRNNNQNELSFLNNTFTNNKLLKLFNYRQRNFEKYDSVMQECKKISFDSLKVEYLQTNLQSIFSILGTAATMIIGTSLIISNMLTIGVFIAFVNLSDTVKSSLDYVVSLNDSLQQTIVSAKRLYEYVNETTACNELLEGQPLHKIDYIQAVDLELRMGERVLCENATFTLKSNHFYYLIGKNGIGKSTFIDALLGFINVEEQQLLINGIPIGHINKEQLRERISVVLQKNYFMQDSIENNIFFGTDRIDEKRKAAVFELLGLNIIMERLPDGLMTQMDDLHNKFSGGELRKLSIARALLKDADVYIFDEAFVNVDQEVKRKIHNEICEMLRDRIVIFVTHDSDIMKECKGDIIEFKDGEFILCYQE